MSQHVTLGMHRCAWLFDGTWNFSLWFWFLPISMHAVSLILALFWSWFFGHAAVWRHLGCILEYSIAKNVSWMLWAATRRMPQAGQHHLWELGWVLKTFIAWLLKPRAAARRSLGAKGPIFSKFCCCFYQFQPDFLLHLLRKYTGWKLHIKEVICCCFSLITAQKEGRTARGAVKTKISWKLLFVVSLHWIESAGRHFFSGFWAGCLLFWLNYGC